MRAPVSGAPPNKNKKPLFALLHAWNPYQKSRYAVLQAPNSYRDLKETMLSFINAIAMVGQNSKIASIPGYGDF